MSELFRIMKPGGWGIFQVPIDWNNSLTYEDSSITSLKDREKHFWQKDHLRLYGLDYPDKLKAVGFNVEAFDYHQHMDKEEIKKYRFHENEILYILKKP
jgi:hypothetical protein